MSTIEQQILEKLGTMKPEQKQRVLEFVEGITAQKQHLTARDLMRLPFEERTAILQVQLAEAAEDDFEEF